MSGHEGITVAVALLTGRVAGQHLDQGCQFLTDIALVHAALREVAHETGESVRCPGRFEGRHDIFERGEVDSDRRAGVVIITGWHRAHEEIRIVARHAERIMGIGPLFAAMSAA